MKLGWLTKHSGDSNKSRLVNLQLAAILTIVLLLKSLKCSFNQPIFIQISLAIIKILISNLQFYPKDFTSNVLGNIMAFHCGCISLNIP